jgi:hypothetical protein
MSFGVVVARTRDSSLPYAHRVASFRNCVSAYHPIGYEASLSYLQAKAGPFQYDEAALLRALELLIISRELWKEDARQYTARRLAEKRSGRRVPRAGEANPQWPAYWYGAPVEAAAYAVKHRRRAMALRGLSLPLDDRVVTELDSCLTAFVATAGQLDAEQWLLFSRCAAELKSRLTPEARDYDVMVYTRNKNLLDIARLIETAAKSQ